MNLARIVLVLAGGCELLRAQAWDTFGNGMLTGNYYFREVFFTSEAAVSLYGNMVFSGSGTYTVNAAGYQCTNNGCGLGSYQSTGTYSIGAAGFGFLSNGLLNSATIGSVGANGIFIGSATETGASDLFIAAPVSSQTSGTLQGNYSASYLNPGAQVPFSALLQFNSNGSGSFGNVNVAAYATSSTPLTQTIAGVRYLVSNNAFVVTFPNNNTNVVVGQEYLYTTPDGSFIFGGSPRDFDMIVGIRTDNAAAGLSGLYYEAGMDVDNSTGAGTVGAFYGSFIAGNNSSIVGHQRIQGGGIAAFSFVYHDAYPVELGATYNDLARSRQFLVGGGVRVGVGIGPYPAVSVAVQALKAKPAMGMFLDPTSAVNTASHAPFTTGISSGEIITLTGTNLGPTALAVSGAIPLATTVGGVQVFLNNRAIPILAASATQITVQMPYNTAVGTGLIYVTYNGAQSNTIATLINTTTPGVFTIPTGGVSRASARHSNGALVTPDSPAKIGETVSVYLTGLGDPGVNVADGGVGPTVTPAKPVAVIAVYVNGIPVTPSFLALAPGLVGLYQLQFAIPPGVTTGDTFLDVAGPDSYSSQATIAVTSAAANATTRGERPWRPPVRQARPGAQPPFGPTQPNP